MVGLGSSDPSTDGLGIEAPELWRPCLPVGKSLHTPVEKLGCFEQHRKVEASQSKIKYIEE